MRTLAFGLMAALLLPVPAPAEIPEQLVKQLPGLSPDALRQGERLSPEVRVNNLCGETITLILRWQDANNNHAWTRTRWFWEPVSGQLASSQGLPIAARRPQAWLHAARADGTLVIESAFMESFEHQGQELRFEPILLGPGGGTDITLCGPDNEATK